MTNEKIDYQAVAKAKADYEELLSVAAPIAARLVSPANSPEQYQSISMMALGLARELIGFARAELGYAMKAAGA
jgi:hypothetical protein